MSTRVCAVEGCGGVVKSRGWCQKHYVRYWRTGEVGNAEPAHRRGPDHPNWSSPERLTYSGAHRRVRDLKGSAREHHCVSCANQADTWAYRHDEGNPLVDERGIPYSADPDRYEPMCFGCHTRADHGRKRDAS